MRELTENLRLEAERRLEEIEYELNVDNFSQNIRHSQYTKVDLIKERLQLRLVLDKLLEHRPIGSEVAPHDHSHLHKEDIMKIEFETDTNDSLQFYMVRDGQMFISEDGCLYQKSSETDGEAWMICNSNGEPSGNTENFDDDQLITKLLPMIRRIAF